MLSTHFCWWEKNYIFRLRRIVLEAMKSLKKLLSRFLEHFSLMKLSKCLKSSSRHARGSVSMADEAQFQRPVRLTFAAPKNDRFFSDDQHRLLLSNFLMYFDDLFTVPTYLPYWFCPNSDMIGCRFHHITVTIFGAVSENVVVLSRRLTTERIVVG